MSKVATNKFTENLPMIYFVNFLTNRWIRPRLPEKFQSEILNPEWIPHFIW